MPRFPVLLNQAIVNNGCQLKRFDIVIKIAFSTSTADSSDIASHWRPPYVCVHCGRCSQAVVHACCGRCTRVMEGACALYQGCYGRGMRIVAAACILWQVHSMELFAHGDTSMNIVARMASVVYGHIYHVYITPFCCSACAVQANHAQD